MQTAFHTRLKRKKQPLAGKPAVAVSFFSLLTTPHPTPQIRVPCTLSLLRSFCLWLAGILPALK